MTGRAPFPRRAALWGLLAAAALGGACGYSSGRIRPEHTGSVGVEIFKNDGPEPDIEAPLHAEMSRAVRDLVDAPLVDPREARLVVRGRIIDYRRRGGIRSSDNVQLESGVSVVVEADLYDPLAREVRRSLPPTSVWVGYLLGSSAVDNELEARDRALRNIADRVVLDLFLPVD